MTGANRKWWALGAIALAVLAVGLDGTILAVALPTLAPALHASSADLVWFSSAYLLALAAAMLPAGVLGDRYGRKKVLLSALVLFGAASVLAAEAPNAAVFIVARAIGGVAGAGVIVMAMAALTVLFTEEERPRAVGIWAAVNFLALPIGPVLGGWLLTHAWWGWVFLINVPVIAVAFAVGFVLVPETRARDRRAVDGVGIAAFTAGLVAIVYGLVEAGGSGWLSPRTGALLLAGAVLLVAFARYERWLSVRPGREPLVDLGLFRSRAFTWGTGLAAISSLAMIGVLFTLPQYFQGVRGLDAVGSGLRLLPLIGGLALGAAGAEAAARAWGATRVTAAGFAILAGGLLLGSFSAVGSAEGFIAGWMALCGAGLGITLAVTSSAALSQLPSERSGVGAAVMQALQEVGSPFGAAILGSISIAAYRAQLNFGPVPPGSRDQVSNSVFDGVSVARRIDSPGLLANVHSAFTHGMSNALLASAAIALLGAGLALVFFPSASRQVEEVEPERTASVGRIDQTG